MISRWEWIWTLITRRLWFRAGLYGIAAVVTALVAAFVPPVLDNTDITEVFGADSVEDILRIMASSMLAVATFSLGTMVSAFAAAASTATPRASRLLVEDSTSQNVLSTFIGAFIFSLVGIIALSTSFYGPTGRVILFFVTLIVIAGVLITFFRWIDYLSHLGRLGETVDKVEAATAKAIMARWQSPHLGCAALVSVPTSSFPLLGKRIGYIQYLDVSALSRIAETAGGSIYVVRLPGAFSDTTEPLAWTSWEPDEDERAALINAFLIDSARSFPQDPRFGLIVLSEIASRALSPGINDPGTAIDIIGRVVRILSILAGERDAEADEIHYPSVFIPTVSVDDAFDDVFNAIARDGAATLEVGIRMQKAFRTLARMGRPDFGDNARRHSALALKRSLAALTLDEDKRTIEAIAAEVGAGGDQARSTSLK